MGSGNFDFRSGRAGGAIPFYILFCFEGKVGEKIKWMPPQIGRAGAGGRSILFWWSHGLPFKTPQKNFNKLPQQSTLIARFSCFLGRKTWICTSWVLGVENMDPRVFQVEKHGSARFLGRNAWIRAFFGSKNMDPRVFRGQAGSTITQQSWKITQKMIKTSSNKLFGLLGPLV